MSTSPRKSVDGKQRYNKGQACPICGGSEDDDRGTGSRCFGYIGSDGLYAHCTREEKAGGLPQNPNSHTFAHKLKGECKCGVEHGPAEPRVARPPRKAKANGLGPIVATYNYVDENGNLLFQATRHYPPKDFRQRKPSGIPGTWIFSIVGVRRVLYRLPELIASDPAQPVFIVEGEKDVENLRALGLVATCNPMGAGKWRKWEREYNPPLKGRIVYIVADNDADDKGRNHARKVAESLAGVASEVKWLDLVEPCRALGLGELPDKGDVSDFLQMGGKAEDLLRLFQEAPQAKPQGRPDRSRPTRRAGGGEPSDGDVLGLNRSIVGAKPEGRPAIEINTQWNEAVEQAIQALAADEGLYCRGDSLVRVIQETNDTLRISTRTTIKRLAGSPKIISLSDSNVGCSLTSVAEFYKWRKDQNGELVAIDVSPPDWLIKSVATRKHWPGIRQLIAVAECPFPRHDGSIVEMKGFDEETGTLYMPSITFAPIPEKPTKEDASAAWNRIAEYICDFPFATDDDKVVYLAGVLTIIARPAIAGNVPGIAVIGNKASTGKGLLIDAMVLPGTGRRCPTMSYPDKEDEAIKVKVSIAKAAKIAVHFDNIVEGRQYGSGPLDSALTSPEIDDRQLGRNDAPVLALRSAWFLSGNNIGPCKDAYRRWLVCNLRTDLEYPERRTDLTIPDLRGTILENRAAIVGDALTILRAHSLAGRPTCPGSGFGSFEDWDLVVRGAVWFATGRDCLATQIKASEESPERMEKIALLEGLIELPGAKLGQRGVTARDAIQEIIDNQDRYETLRGALYARGSKGALATSEQLGKILRGLANTPISGLKLHKHHALQHGAAAWMVERLPGEVGEVGEDVSVPHREKSGSNSDTSTSGEKCETCSAAPQADSPTSPTSPTEKPWRSIVRTWPERWFEEYRRMAEKLNDAGQSIIEAEREAFAQVSKQKAEQVDYERAAGGLTAHDCDTNV